MAAKKDALICYPFDEEGNMLNYVKVDKLSAEEAEECYIKGSLKKTYAVRYPGGTLHVQNIEWRPNRIFKATLELVKQKNGCSSKVAIWKDQTTGKTYTMFIRDVLDLILVDHGYHILTGEFSYVKRGANYGIKWLHVLHMKTLL